MSILNIMESITKNKEVKENKQREIILDPDNPRLVLFFHFEGIEQTEEYKSFLIKQRNEYLPKLVSNMNEENITDITPEYTLVKTMKEILEEETDLGCITKAYLIRGLIVQYFQIVSHYTNIDTNLDIDEMSFYICNELGLVEVIDYYNMYFRKGDDRWKKYL